jgi:hypothetical protein
MAMAIFLLYVVQIRHLLGTEITPLQVFQLRNVCSVSRLRYSKKTPSMQKSLHIETFLFQKKKGSSHIRKVLLNRELPGIPHNINKFSNNMDIVVSGEQSKFLNSFWTSSFLSNQDKTFFFNFHNNTLGYNNAVAHFVRGHSPNCTFCDIVDSPGQNNETPVHLFFRMPNCDRNRRICFSTIY